MALRRPLETHFEPFWGLLVNSEGLWKFILNHSGVCSSSGSGPVDFLLSHSGVCSRNSFQEASGGSFEQFLGLFAKLLSGNFWRLILSHSGVCSPNGSQEVSGCSF